MYPYISFFGKNISSYGLCMLIALFLVYFLSSRRGKKNGIVSENIIIVMAVSTGFILLGGCLLYIFVNYTPRDLLELVSKGDFSFFESSGLVFYGGLFGAVAGVFIGSKIAKMPLREVCYVILPFVPFGHAIGRVGCFLAGCCHGIEYDGLFAVYYKHSIFGLSPEQGYFPVQLAESLCNALIGFILVNFSKKTANKINVAFLYLMLYSICRFCLEYARGDAERGFVGVFSTSQTISIILFSVSAIYFAVFKILALKRELI